MDRYELPQSWVWTTIGEITQPIEKVQPSNNPEEEFVYLDISSIDNTNFKIVEPKHYTGKDAPSRARQLVKAYDVLFSTVRTYLMNIAQVPEIYDGQIASTGFSVLRAENGIIPGYLFYYCLTPEFLNPLEKLQRGTSYPAVRDGDVREQSFPLPPLAEQQRIVDEIEAQFTRLDAVVAALKRTRATLKRYRASVLKTACEGRLVPQNPSDEPAGQLLERILVERQQCWEAEQVAKARDLKKLKYKEPPSPDLLDFPNLPELPKGWVWVNIGQLTWSVKDGPHYSPQYADEGVPFITGGNVRPSGVDFENAKRISFELYKELSKRCKPEVGDILYTKGGTTGIARVNTYDTEFTVWVHVAVLKLAGPIDPFYIQHALNSPFCYEQAQRYTHGVGNQDLGLTRMVNIALGLPPLAEQQRIVEEVERRLSVMDEVEATLAANLKRAERLRQAILKRAFEGKFVPQNPADEPASALLERIRAAKGSRQMGLPGV